jgi:hypothetical protein
MARELAPRNIYVAHLIIDGAIDTSIARSTYLTRVRGG